MSKERPCVLSIAGFDPAGGAGLLADIKTFEQHRVLGMGVVTGVTFQNDSEFDGVKWLQTDEIIKQLDVLTRKFKFRVVKIGLLQSLESLEAIISTFRPDKSPNEGPRLIWDPILKASAGFEIHRNFEKEKLISILKNIYLITPNRDEIKVLSGNQDEMGGAQELANYCNVFLKGGHIIPKGGLQNSEGNDRALGKDYLFTHNGKIFPYRPKKISETGKHGSGCVLSSGIAANLANGNTLQRSCLKGKEYVTKILTSNKTLLGYHKI
jgi:hydroxymethylpyrimidine/phosphomethylpyrimidine kinase